MLKLLLIMMNNITIRSEMEDGEDVYGIPSLL